jgi:hypothetical protein
MAFLSGTPCRGTSLEKFAELLAAVSGLFALEVDFLVSESSPSIAGIPLAIVIIVAAISE